LAGPLFSIPVSKTVAWDFRPMIGYSVTTVSDVGDVKDEAMAFAFNLGTLIRIDLNQKYALTFNADYFSTKPYFKDYGFEQNIGTISIGVGLAYRFK